MCIQYCDVKYNSEAIYICIVHHHRLIHSLSISCIISASSSTANDMATHKTPPVSIHNSCVGRMMELCMFLCANHNKTCSSEHHVTCRKLNVHDHFSATMPYSLIIIIISFCLCIYNTLPISYMLNNNRHDAVI